MTSNKQIGIEVHVAQRESDAKWLAATAASPYFCFVCDSRDEAIRRAQSAVEFFHDSLVKIQDVQLARERDSAVPHFREVTTELLCA